jgi:hypothetical protein
MRDAAWLGIHTLRRRRLRRLMKRFRLLSSIFGALLLSSVLAVVVVPAEAATVVVDSHTYLYMAGGNTSSGGAGGIDPALFSFAALPGQSITVSNVTGITDCDGVGGLCAPTGADGNLGADGPIGAVGSLSGVNLRGSLSLVLLGVFLDAGLPGSAPSTLDFRNVENFTTLSPLLGQVFWIGDGLTGTGSGTTQTFVVPATATRFYMGFGDFFAGDNSGQLSATVDLTTPSVGAPEPGSALLLGAGLALLLGGRRNRGRR